MSIRSLLPKSSAPVSWPVAILSLIPLLLAGPMVQLINYHPGWDPQKLPWIAAAYAPVTVGLLVLGFLTGLLRKFPRWTYLYSLYVLFLLVFVTTFLVYGRPWNMIDDWLILLLWIAAAILAIYWLPPLRPFLENIRQDWTVLSYAMFGGTLFILSMHDMDMSPAYDLEVLLPGLIAWLGLWHTCAWPIH